MWNLHQIVLFSETIFLYKKLHKRLLSFFTRTVMYDKELGGLLLSMTRHKLPNGKASSGSTSLGTTVSKKTEHPWARIDDPEY